MKRGDCDNPTKVRNAQEFGAQVALISDDRDETLDGIVMEDETNGSTVPLTIPGYMIGHDAALLIRDTINEGLAVFLRSELSITTSSSDQLQLSLFMSSSVDVDSSVMDTFALLAYESAKTAHESAI
jgi:hypothetical protein